MPSSRSAPSDHQGGHVAPPSSRSGRRGNGTLCWLHLELNYGRIALRNMSAGQAKVTRPEIKVGDMVRIRLSRSKAGASTGSTRLPGPKKKKDSPAKSGETGQGLAWRGGRKRWCAGILRGPRLPPPFSCSLSLYRGFPKWILFYLRGSWHSSVQRLTSSCEGFEV